MPLLIVDTMPSGHVECDLCRITDITPAASTGMAVATFTAPWLGKPLHLCHDHARVQFPAEYSQLCRRMCQD